MSDPITAPEITAPETRTIDNPVTIPPLSLVFGYGPMLLIVAAGIGGWVLPPFWAGASVAVGSLWASSILLFLAGVTRGLSFFTPGGAQRGQLGQMLWLHALGFVSLLAPVRIALVLLIAGYGSIALFDPPAARRGWAPAHFAKLRFPQMMVGIVGLLALLARVTLAG